MAKKQSTDTTSKLMMYVIGALLAVLILGFWRRTTGNTGLMGGTEVFSVLLSVSLLLLPIALIVMWIVMFLDAIRNNKISDTEKLIWCLSMVFLPVMFIVYYFVVYKNKK